MGWLLFASLLFQEIVSLLLQKDPISEAKHRFYLAPKEEDSSKEELQPRSPTKHIPKTRCQQPKAFCNLPWLFDTNLLHIHLHSHE